MILWVDQNITNSSLEASQWSFHWAYTGFPGCHQVATRDFQCEKFEVNIHNLLMFEGLWQPLVSKVTGIGSPVSVRSWDPRVLWCHAHPRCYPANTVRDSQLKVKKCQILVFGWGGTAQTDRHTHTDWHTHTQTHRHDENITSTAYTGGNKGHHIHRLCTTLYCHNLVTYTADSVHKSQHSTKVLSIMKPCLEHNNTV